MHIENLTLEVTRKCNLRCEHCLRGNAQNKSIGEDVVASLFSNIDSIGTLTLGGGEPSLAIKEIKMIRNYLLWSDTEIENIFLVTNGKRISIPLLKTYESLYQLCTDKEMSQFAISNDKYHYAERKFHRNIYDYVDTCLENDIYLHLPEEVFVEQTTYQEHMPLIARGRAKNMGEEKEIADNLILNSINNPTKISGEMYVCYNGDILGDVELPYLDAKNYVRGNVNNWYNFIENLKISTKENLMWCAKNCPCFWENHNNEATLNEIQTEMNKDEKNCELCSEWINFKEAVLELVS